MKNRWRGTMKSCAWPAIIAAGLGVALVLSGCTSYDSGPADAATGPQTPLTMNEQFVLYRESAESDFEREVLDRAIETGSIAAADYDEAVTRYVACAKDAGHTIEAVMQSNGIYRWEERASVDEDRYFDDTSECGFATGLATIESLYKVQVANPTGLPQGEAVVACLREAGVVDETYDSDQFWADSESAWNDAPYDVTDVAVTTCLSSLGFAVGP